MALGGAVVGRTRRWIHRRGALGALVPLALFAAGCGGSETAITGVSDAVASLTITVDSESGVPAAQEAVVLDVGDSVELSATATNALGLAVTNVSATWSSSAPTVVEVGGDGVATALASGSAEVHAMIDDVVATIRIVVNESTPVPPPTP